MNIEFQVGKRYETRNGYVAALRGYDEKLSGTCLAFSGVVYSAVNPGDILFDANWREDGVFDRLQHNGNLDLVRELPDEITDEPALTTHPDGEPVRVISDEQQAAITAADAAAPAPLQLEVGKWYRRRDGGIVQVTERDDGLKFGAGTYPYVAVGFSYTENGVYCVDDDGMSHLDLIEEIPAPVAEAVAEMEFKPGPVTHVFPDLGVKLEGDTFSAIDAPLPMDPLLAIGEELRARQQTSGETRGQRYDREEEEDRQFGRIAQRAQHAEYLQNTRADRVETYARAILFVMLGVAAMTFATRATARELLSIPNNAGGEIILTDTPSEHCDGAARLAISRAAGGKTIVGCWVYSDAGYVYVKWGDDLRLYKLTDFRIIEQFDEPEKPATQTTPWRGV